MSEALHLKAEEACNACGAPLTSELAFGRGLCMPACKGQAGITEPPPAAILVRRKVLPFNRIRTLLINEIPFPRLGEKRSIA